MEKYHNEMCSAPPIEWSKLKIDELDDLLKSNIVKSAENAGMARREKKIYTKNSKKPWCDRECERMKREVRKCLRKCKKSKFKYNDNLNYKQSKKKYTKLLRNKKLQYEQSLSDSVANCQNSKSFWKIINKFRNNNATTNPILPETWKDYFDAIYPPRDKPYDTFTDVRHPLLDAPITQDEIILSLSKCKLNKAPGPDGIRSEFYKYLPDNWLLFLECLFNRILESESFPTSWTEIHATMIHKKGDKNNPSNYRCISLVNSITKIFTQILYDRLTQWAEESRVLPEFQSGFRRNRGCRDNVFILNSIIQIKLSQPKRNLYAFVIDFVRAFDSIKHSLLWKKLFKIGVSGKFIRLCQSLYNRANISVRCQSGVSEKVDVTEGVLQGEILSPLFFALFLSDIEEFFLYTRSKGRLQLITYMKSYYWLMRMILSFSQIHP